MSRINMRKSYTELSRLKTYEERLSYLQCNSSIGVQTFGSSRYLNQMLYKLPQWQESRDIVIVRDGGWDLGIKGCDASDHCTVHHINPITVQQVLDRDPEVFDPENLITCSGRTHRRIHYDKTTHNDRDYVERKPYDTCPWKVTK